MMRMRISQYCRTALLPSPRCGVTGLRSQLSTIPSVASSFGTILDGSLPQNKDYHINKETMDKLVATLKTNLATVYEGGGPKMCARHKSRGKLLARERINMCLDTGSPFLELNALAAFGMEKELDVPSGGIITGIGKVNG
jgi:3-methylcrotonyl-CoA carboxylase beta subunit